MNKSIVLHYLSKVLLAFSVLFLVPAAVSLIYGENGEALIFAATGLATAAPALPFSLKKPKSNKMYAKEGLVITALLWIIMPVIGAAPFYFSGEIPRLCDAVFESISGFTTTGSTILTDIESMSKGMLFWRSFTHWVGGMGVLVLAIAVLPSSDDSMVLMRAECPGPQVGKVVPKGKKSAAALYIIYAVLTLITALLLMLGGMPVFDSICHALGTAGTGGFGIKNSGVGYYDSAYIEGVLTVTMLIFGVNFSLYYSLINKRFRDVLKNTELKVYLAIAAAATVLVMLNIYPIYGTMGKSFRYAVFQVSSIMTSTGYGTADYNQWPMFSQNIIISLMFIGACAGSTGGGFKVQRVVILFKSALKTLRKVLRPNSVNIVKSDDKTMASETVHGVLNYLIIYIFLIFVSIMIVSLDNADFGTTFSSVVTCINNIGPGINRVGPAENFSFFSDLSKIVLSADMILGRLECFPVIIMLSPSVWRY